MPWSSPKRRTIVVSISGAAITVPTRLPPGRSIHRPASTPPAAALRSPPMRLPEKSPPRDLAAASQRPDCRIGSPKPRPASRVTSNFGESHGKRPSPRASRRARIRTRLRIGSHRAAPHQGGGRDRDRRGGGIRRLRTRSRHDGIYDRRTHRRPGHLAATRSP
jgi:hypothetical protein